MNAHEVDRYSRERGCYGMTGPALVTLDERDVVVQWSPGAQRLLGYGPQQVVGRPVTGLLASGTLADACGEGRRGEVGMRHRDGRLLRLAVRVDSLEGRGGAVHRLLTACPADGSAAPDGPAVLDWLRTGSPVALTVYDAELRFLWQSAAMARFGGTAGHGPAGFRGVAGQDARAWERRMRTVAATGEPATGFLLKGCSPDGVPDGRVLSAAASVLRGREGQVSGVCCTVSDVTAERLASARLELLSEASTRIGSTLDVTRTAQEMADLAVSRLADFVSVDLLEPLLRGDDPEPATESAVLRRVAHSSVAPGVPETVARPGDVDRYLAQSPPVRCLAAGRSVMLDMTDPVVAEWMAHEPARAAKSREFGFRCLMVVPLVARGTTLGVAVFIRWRRKELFEQDDLALAEELAARAAVSLDNARRYTRERTIALDLQRSLLPHRLPRSTAVDAVSCYLPTAVLPGVGGDWFDVITLPGARVALVVGDIVGHGVQAAAGMGRLRTAVRTLADVDLSPDELLTRLDNVVNRINAEEGAQVDAPGGELFATCLYSVYSAATGRCHIASAGHPPPAIRTPDGRVAFPDLPVGPPLGMGDLPFEAAELELPEGTILALYTDGLIASYNRDPDSGLELLRGVIERPVVSLDAFRDTVVQAMLPEHPADDAALLVARTRLLDTGRIASLDLPADPAAVADARAWADRTLAVWGVQDDVAGVTELVVSELVTNAIRYGGGPVRLTLIRDDALICEVSDSTTTAPHLRHAKVLDEGGRGLLLVAQLTHRWGTRLTTEGKTIWCEQLLPAAARGRPGVRT